MLQLPIRLVKHPKSFIGPFIGVRFFSPQPTVDNIMGTKNNVVHVKPSDFDVIQALELDQANSKHRPNQMDSMDVSEFMPHPPHVR